jgi:hypothetical protein
MKNLAMAAALLGAVITSFAANTARAEFTIRLDNQANGASYPWAGTDDAILVYAVFKGDNVRYPVGTFRALDTISPAHDFVWTGSQPYWSLVRIVVAINSNGQPGSGRNMFWLDEIELIYNSVVKWHSGGDNTDGRCFSHDSNDWQEHPEACQPDSTEIVHPYDLPPL